MFVDLIVVISVVIQFTTVVLALRLVRITGNRMSWILISFAIFFMAVRRSIVLFHITSGEPYLQPDLLFETVGLAASVLMLAGVIWISPLFKSMARNITELREVEGSLRGSEAKYRSLVESTDDSIYLLDRDCRYLFMNERHLSRLGLSKTEGEGKDYGEFHPPEDTNEFAGLVGRVFDTGESVRYEYRSSRDGGYFLRTLSPVKRPDGEIIAVTVVSKSITELKLAEEKVRQLSLTDELTGLYNRRGFLTLVRHQLETARRAKQGAMLLFADLDGLKRINDDLGHEKGDMALVDVAHILKNTFREVDAIARVGGDEFAIFMTNVPESHAGVLTERLKENIDARNKEGKRPYKLSLSVGAALYDPAGAPGGINELLQQADNHMYEEKRKKMQKER